jgi:predicted site-specific integrase-resolvase
LILDDDRNMTERLLRTAEAARALGLHPQTLRRFTKEGLITCERVNARGDRRYVEREVARFRAERTGASATRRAVLYVRVSGSTGQESSLKTQESELRERCLRDGVEVAGVYRDRASGLSEKRQGLRRMLEQVARERIDEVRVTHRDRLARFGSGWIEDILGSRGTSLVVEHAAADATPQDELLSDFMSLVACFSGRLYGQRSAEARRRLLEQAGSASADESVQT